MKSKNRNAYGVPKIYCRERREFLKAERLKMEPPLFKRI